MNIINFAESNSIINQYVAELRDIKVQTDRNTFRHNLQRIGQMMAYEVSKTLQYSEKTIQTPLAEAQANTPDDNIVLATVFRAGLPFHQGFLDVFDHAGNAFVSAYRYYLDEKHAAALSWPTKPFAPKVYRSACISAASLPHKQASTTF